MGDWRENKDKEIQLDGIGGVNIMVKADVHRSGKYSRTANWRENFLTSSAQASTSLAMHSRTKQRPKASRRWPSEQDTASTVSRIMSSGTLTRKRSQAMHD